MQEDVPCGYIIGSDQPYDRALAMKVQGDKVLKSMGALRSDAMPQRSSSVQLFSVQALCNFSVCASPVQYSQHSGLWRL